MTSSNSGSLSQSYFDETVEENEDVFDMAPDEAVAETIDQLFKQAQTKKNNASLSLSDWKQQQRLWWGISLTHPTTASSTIGGQEDRQQQEAFRQALNTLLSTNSEDTDLVQAAVEQIWTVFLRDDEKLASTMKPTTSNISNSEEKEEEHTPEPVLLGSLFWKSLSTTSDNNDDDENNNKDATNNSTTPSTPDSTQLLLLGKLAEFASNTLVLQVALKSLAVVGPKDVRRHRQELMLRYFCLPCQGWERLFDNKAYNDDQLNNKNTATKDQRQQNQLLWMQLIHNVCHGHEPNKKYCNSKPILKTLVTTLEQLQEQQQKQQQQNDYKLMEATSRLITVLCRFDDFSSQATDGQATDNTGMVVSSAHSTVTTLAGMGIVTILCDLLLSLKQLQQEPRTPESTAALLAILQSLRSIAIQDEIVVRMVSTGLMEVLQSIFQTYCSIYTASEGEQEASNSNQQQSNNDDESQNAEKLRLAILTALIGLYRNLSANDDLKTTLCRSPKQSILAPLVASLQSLNTSTTNQSASQSAALTKLQEHGCATLGSMALRQPQNAEIIVQDYQGHLVILKAMELSHHSGLVQRQGALAIRNLASRASSNVNQSLLDAGAEPILRKAATLGAVDEAYAALRDLGCHAQLLQSNPETGQLERQAMFGEKPLQFRAVYD